ncbi:MAG: DUF423 domain-containing protein [Alphaproteobacteria bacterium]|nr:DUF423 domain-containing protein [Alphaproteobacteria bacterium]
MPPERSASLIVATAGLLGAAGVSLAATAAHVDGAVALRAAAEMALVHAAAAIAIVAYANHARRPGVFRWIATAMLAGALLFVSSVSLGVLADFRPLPALAPVGGTVTIVAWLAVFLSAIFEAARAGGR